MFMAAGLAYRFVLFMLVGFLCRKFQVVGDAFIRDLAKFLTAVIIPCLSYASITAQEFDPNELRNCLILLAMGGLVVATDIAVGEALYILEKRTPAARIHRYGCSFLNFGFMGLPIMGALYGDQGVFYGSILSIVGRTLLYATPDFFMNPDFSGHDPAQMVRSIRTALLSPSVISVIIGLFVYITGWHLPGLIEGVINSIGSTSGSLGMILIGMVIGQYPIKKLLKFRYGYLTLFRNFLIPAIVLCEALLLGVAPMIRNIMVIYVALPLATFLSIYTIKYFDDTEMQYLSAGSILFSTLVSVLSLPLWGMILERFPA